MVNISMEFRMRAIANEYRRSIWNEQIRQSYEAYLAFLPHAMMNVPLAMKVCPFAGYGSFAQLQQDADRGGFIRVSDQQPRHRRITEGAYMTHVFCFLFYGHLHESNQFTSQGEFDAWRQMCDGIPEMCRLAFTCEVLGPYAMTCCGFEMPDILPGAFIEPTLWLDFLV